MMEQVGQLTGNLLLLLSGMLVRYYPLRQHLVVSTKCLVVVYAVFYVLQSIFMQVMQEETSFSFRGVYLFRAFTMSFFPIWMPFFLTRKRFWQNLLLLTISGCIMLVVNGFANYAELAWGDVFVAGHPYLLSNLIVFGLLSLILPFVLWALDILFSTWPDGQPHLWRVIWILPAVLLVFCAYSSSILQGEASITTPNVVIFRVLLTVGVVVTCLVMVWSMRQVELCMKLEKEHYLMERQIDIQQEQYERLSEDLGRARQARHDLRQELAVLKNLAATKDMVRLQQFVEKMAGAIPAPSEHAWCENYAVNAIVDYYITLLQQENALIDVKLAVPSSLGQVSDMELCIVVGNLLENVLDACRCISPEKRLVRMRSQVQGQFLSLLTENAYDGLYKAENGEYFSTKRKDSNQQPIKGIGLSSIQNICERHDGMMRIEVDGQTWRVSALLTIA